MLRRVFSRGTVTGKHNSTTNRNVRVGVETGGTREGGVNGGVPDRRGWIEFGRMRLRNGRRRLVLHFRFVLANAFPIDVLSLPFWVFYRGLLVGDVRSESWGGTLFFALW